MAPSGPYDLELEAAVRRFQRDRGLLESGLVDLTTWRAIVEAGYRLGDRLLYLRRPPLRGDDVAWLQNALGSLGFDPGRVDGIFGARTRSALIEFQSNVGLPADGICGVATIEELRRVGAHRGAHVHSVIERLTRERGGRKLADVAVVVSAEVVLEGVAELVGSRIRRHGTSVVVVASDDQSELARIINNTGPDVFFYFGYSLGGEYVAYYSGYSYVSPVGRQLASELVEGLGPERRVALRGMSLPVLRETRAPGAAIAMADAHHWWSAAPAVGDMIVEAVAKVVCGATLSERT